MSESKLKKDFKKLNSQLYTSTLHKSKLSITSTLHQIKLSITSILHQIKLSVTSTTQQQHMSNTDTAVISVHSLFII